MNHKQETDLREKVKDGNIFTETVQGFLKRKPNITILGMAWAVYWRFTVLMIAIWLGVFIVVALIGTLFNI